MLPVVLNRIISFNKGLEGYIHHMYLDVKGLVTVGVGNLLSSSAVAAALPFTNGLNGPLAAAGDKTAGWNAVHAAPAGKPVSDAGDSYSALSPLRLGDAAIDTIVLAKAASFDLTNAAMFPNYPSFSADAQLGMISMQWPGSFNTFPTFQAHVKKGEWFGAARQCYFDETNNPGLKPRNLANRWLFSLMGRAVGMSLPTTTLYLDNPGANKLFLFKGGQYLRYDWDTDTVDSGYPAASMAWSLPSPFSQGVDAAVNGLGEYKVPAFYGKSYFFRGNQYVRYDWDSDAIDVGPAPLTAWGLTGKFASGIDAAVNGQGKYFGKLYFFKGDTYVRYDWATDKLDQGEQSIASGWSMPATFASGIDAIVSGEGPYTNRLYFFKGSEYIRCSWKPYAVLSAPTAIGPAWGGLGAKGFGSNIGAAINGPGCVPDMQLP
jgi:GH24 family phage-related lysozyme (muramidase)